MNVAIIPARGGSKRIPRKNIREFAGQPIISYSIRAARQAGIIDQIIVSTDDEEIASVARDFGAEIPFVRPPEISEDYSGTNEVVAHAISWLVSNGAKLNAVCCIYATAPLIEATDIASGYEVLTSGNWNYVFSATTYAFPVYRAFKLDGGEQISMLWPEHQTTRSQDLPDTYHDAGQFYWGKPQAFLDSLPIFDKHSTIVRVPRHRVQDIDTFEDWAHAEALYAALSDSNRDT